MITAVIPAAGRSERFAIKGYDVRKPFLMVTDSDGVTMTMLEHVIARIPAAVADTVVGVPPAYVRAIRGVDATIVSIAETVSQIDTVRQILQYVLPHSGVLTMDADTILDPAPMIRDDNPDVVLAVCREPDKWQAATNEACTEFEEPPYAGLPYGVVSLRYFHNAELLLKACEGSSTFTDVLRKYPARTRAVRVMTGWQDWGTPDNLMRNGARVA